METTVESGRAEALRIDIKKSLEKVGLSPVLQLVDFDLRCPTFASKQDLHRRVLEVVAKTQLHQVEKCFDEQGWGVSERLTEFRKFGIMGNLKNASAEQIDAMWSDYRNSNMIIPQKL